MKRIRAKTCIWLTCLAALLAVLWWFFAWNPTESVEVAPDAEQAGRGPQLPPAHEIRTQAQPEVESASTSLSIRVSSKEQLETNAPGISNRNEPVTASISTSNSPSSMSTNHSGTFPLELVWIPPGTFIMGSPEDERDRRSNEGPQTRITISRGFWMAKYETTLVQYRFITGKAQIARLPFANREDNWPVTEITWEQANEFCALLTEDEGASNRMPDGYVYRLPTEAEWEYACRAGTKQRFSFGDDPDYSHLEAYAWYRANSSATPHPVGTRLPNPWGLHDMHGNAREWCLDHQRYPGGDTTDPLGSVSDQWHASKGGAWNDNGGSCRSAFRHASLTGPLTDVGFRVALAPNLQ